MDTASVMLKKVAAATAVILMLSPGALARAVDSTDCNVQQPGDENQAVVSSEQKSNGHRWMKAKILIRACPRIVWDTVHDERKKDPDLAYSKVLSESKDQSTLEQKFSLIPIIGTAVCVMHDTEVPLQRIDYNMISSDRFKAMEGSWVLTPGVDANSTYLELSSYCDLGLPVPRPMIDNVTAKKLQRRLANVKQMAENTQIKLAERRE